MENHNINDTDHTNDVDITNNADIINDISDRINDVIEIFSLLKLYMNEKNIMKLWPNDMPKIDIWRESNDPIRFYRRLNNWDRAILIQYYLDIQNRLTVSHAGTLWNN